MSKAKAAGGKGKTVVVEVTSAKIADALYLVSHPLPEDAVKAAPPKPPPTHHIVVVDCSGSMYGELPKLREQLKKKLPKMIGEQDTFSCIWFSGKGQCGVLLEGEKIGKATDLQTVNKVIDKYLQPIGLTGFKEPLELAADLCAKLLKRDEESRGGLRTPHAPAPPAVGQMLGEGAAPLPQTPSAFSLLFMSDGCDNQWRKDEILTAVESVGGKVQAATFVEYGYYADRALLAEMAARSSGAHIFAADFDAFVVELEKNLGKHPSGQPRIDVRLGGDVIGGFAFALDAGDGKTSGDVLALAANGETVYVPDSIRTICYLSPTPVGTVIETRNDFSAHYAALGLYATRMKSDVVFAILKDLADVDFIDSYCNCFGKQAYSAFTAQANEAAFDAKKRFLKGRDPNRLPREDAFTVVELLDLLKESGSRLLLDSDAFVYSKIGRARVDTDPDALKFERIAKPDGYVIRGLTCNQERPNVSVLVIREGTVDLTKKNPPEQEPGKMALPSPFPTIQYKNYAIVEGGLVNVRFLPARIKGKTFKELLAVYKDERLKFGVFSNLDLTKPPVVADDADLDVTFDLLAMPMMNRKSVKETSAVDYFTQCYALIAQKARQKVFNAYAEELLPEKIGNEGFAFMYGETVAAFLKNVGIDQKNGHRALHTTGAVKSGDFYMAKKLAGALKGLGTPAKASLPTLAEAKAGKGGAGGKLMKPIVDEVEKFLASNAYKKSANPTAVLTAWLDAERKAAIAATRAGMLSLSKLTFNVIVGQVWFSEFKDLSETTMTLKLGGVDIACNAKLEEEKIEL
jgi:hypothetical protein